MKFFYVQMNLALVFFLLLLSANRGWAQENSVLLDSKNVFASLKIYQLDDLLQVRMAREWAGRDRLVIAKGSFNKKNRDKLSKALLDQGFKVVSDMSFVGGSGSEWQQVDGVVEFETNFERDVPRSDQLKLIDMVNGEELFLFQSTGF